MAHKKFRQISLSKNKDNKPGFSIVPMWEGHYAQKGLGTCLVFDNTIPICCYDSFLGQQSLSYYGMTIWSNMDNTR